MQCTPTQIQNVEFKNATKVCIMKVKSVRYDGEKAHHRTSALMWDLQLHYCYLISPEFIFYEV